MSAKALKGPTRFIPLAGPLEGGDIWPFLCVWVARVGGGAKKKFLCVCGPFPNGPLHTDLSKTDIVGWLVKSCSRPKFLE